MIVSLLQLGLASQLDTIGFSTGRGACLCILDRVWNIGIIGQRPREKKGQIVGRGKVEGKSERSKKSERPKKKRVGEEKSREKREASRLFIYWFINYVLSFSFFFFFFRTPQSAVRSPHTAPRSRVFGTIKVEGVTEGG